MHRIPRALLPLIYLPTLGFEAVLRLRNALYNSGILRQRLLRNPTISIGNITTGGSGKTPLVVYTSKKILELGFTPIILTRGYGRSSSESLVIAPGESLSSPAPRLGDEPALIRRHVPEAWIGISKKRYAAGNRMDASDKKPVFILDDGFQHRRLSRDLDIAVIDATQPLACNRIVPMGTLREPVSGLRRCHAIVINGGADQREIESLNLKSDRFHCEQYIERLEPFESWIKSDASPSKRLLNRPAFLVAAVGNPLRFEDDIKKFGIRVTGTRFYRDHYRLKPGDWRQCITRARDSGADAIVITEKDAVKLMQPPDFPVFVSVQNTRMDNEEAYLDLLRRCIDKTSKVEGPMSNV
jgi:tetraacyldisaccharide 4'-kinase